MYQPDNTQHIVSHHLPVKRGVLVITRVSMHSRSRARAGGLCGRSPFRENRREFIHLPA
jgi:hypothetical protein